MLAALILAKQNRLGDYVQALNKIINKSKDVEVKKTASELLSNLNKSALPQIDLSKDSTMRDSLNAQYFGISSQNDTTVSELQQNWTKPKHRQLRTVHKYR